LAHLLRSPVAAACSAGLGVLLLWLAWRVLQWAVFGAELRPDAQACRQAAGACWGAVVDRGRMILLGRFPIGEGWRPALAMALLAAALGAAALPRWFNRAGLLMLAAALAGFLVLMRGGVAGMSPASTDLWGGLPLTLFLSALACLGGIPAGILLALGRRAALPLVRWLATGYIELVRAVPLITLLFFGAFVLPLLLPPGLQLDPIARIVICLVAFEAAYIAEVVRGGLQAIPRGQYEAAQALGLTRVPALRLVVLPQALRLTIAPTINNVVGVVKNTSLVAVVNVYDITGALKLALGDPQWKPFYAELYVLVCAVYLALGFSIAAYGRFLERRYAVHSR
jgi:general L-amino acid transport system permease protein